MRVAILTSVHSPGDIRIFHKQAVSLAQAGYEVTLFAPDRPGVDMTSAVSRYGIRYIQLPADSGRLQRVRIWRALAWHLRRNSFDVWHFHDPELLPLSILWKNLFARQVQLIYDVHEDLPKDILDKPWISPPLRKLVAFGADKVERWGMHHCQFVIAATDSIGKRVAGSAHASVVVRNYPLAQAESRIDRNNTSGRPVRVIYSGGLTRIRGVREVIEAMKLLPNEQVELLLLGELYPASFEQEIRSVAGSNVIICGKVAFEKVAGYLEDSDIGIVNFWPLPNHVEAMPNKLFEYMQAGLPVIASDFPLWRQIVEGVGCGLLVNPKDPQHIAAAIQRLTADAELRHQMGQAGAQAVQERYSWPQESQTLLKVYEQLANKK